MSAVVIEAALMETGHHDQVGLARKTLRDFQHLRHITSAADRVH